MSGRLLLLDDDPSILRLLAHRLRRDGHEVATASEGEEALELLRAGRFDLVVSDLSMPGMDGLTFLGHVQALHDGPPVLFLTANSSVPTAVRAMKEGAWDYLEKPIDPERFRRVVEGALAHRALRPRSSDDRADAIPGIVGESPAIQALFRTIDRVARYDAPVLVTGESGTGKELVARALHERSSRAQGPFVAVNGAGIVDSLFESLFFGHEKGSFTGATQAQRGWFAVASGGVLFLDEIGDMPLGQQAKLLRALETQEVVPVGATRPIRVDVRIIAATNRDLRAAIAARDFREDLYYRLRGVEIRLPTLAERREDIPLLARHFLEEATARSGRRASFTPDALAALAERSWPGNARELRQVVVASLMLADGARIGRADLVLDHTGTPSAAAPPPPLLPDADARTAPTASSPAAPPAEADPRLLAFEDVERAHLDRVLALAEGNRSKAAQLLGISRHALYRRLRRHGRL